MAKGFTLEELERKGVVETKGKTLNEITSNSQPAGDFSIGQTVKNIPRSAGRLVGDIASVVTSPIQTAKALGGTAVGAAQKLIPGEQKQEVYADQVAEFFKERYGGMDNIKQTVQEDPVGFLADVATIFTGGGAALRGAGAVTKASNVSRAGAAIQRAGTIAEPLNLIGRGVMIATSPIKKLGGALASEALGVTTGVGGDVIREAFKNPTPEFRQSLRGQSTVDNILTTAREGLTNLKDQRAAVYRAKLEGIKSQTKPINIKPFKDSVDSKLRELNVGISKGGALDFSKSVIADKAEAKRISEFVQTIRRWDDTTPVGLDILKQRLDDFYTPSGRGRALTTSLTSDLRQTLEKNIKGYSEMTKGYQEATQLIKEVEGTLSLGAGARADTTFRKLMSAVKSSNEVRSALISSLDNLSSKNLTSQIAGTALAPKVPTGLIGKSIFAGSLFGGVGMNPAAFWGVAIASPRVVGELLNALGMSKKAADALVAFISSPQGKEILLGGFQAGQIQEATE